MYADNYTEQPYNDEQSYPDDLYEQSKKMDKGYNVIRKSNRKRTKDFAVYSSNGTGNQIRDAETGEYYHNLVGSKDEDLFFKVSLSTGKCKSSNGSNTLFYLSPQHYSIHFKTELTDNLILFWETKRNNRMAEMKMTRKPNGVVVIK